MSAYMTMLTCPDFLYIKKEDIILNAFQLKKLKKFTQNKRRTTMGAYSNAPKDGTLIEIVFAYTKYPLLYSLDQLALHPARNRKRGKKRRKAMSKHTPGPWKVTSESNNTLIECEDGYVIAQIKGVSLSVEGFNYEANARLIAASPKMYELLDKLREVIIETSENGNSTTGLMTVWNTIATDGMDLLDEIDGQEADHENN